MFLLITATPVLAQEEENSPADTPTGWAFRWLNFAIVFGAIAYFAVKYGGPVFRATAEETAKKIEEGARAREEAEKQKKEIEAKLANLPKEIEAMKAEAKRDSEAEAQRLRDQAKEEAQKIEKSALAEIAAAERAARLEVKALAARMAVEKAEVLLRQRLTAKAEQKLFETFVAELERSVN
ncbi:MAG: ATP synthase F0 subunit B [Candidatus Acidiferrales bacterium]